MKVKYSIKNCISLMFVALVAVCLLSQTAAQAKTTIPRSKPHTAKPAPPKATTKPKTNTKTTSKSTTKSTTRSTPKSTQTKRNFQYRTFTVNGVSFDMVPVAGGTFMMGSDRCCDNEKPVHEESVGDFMIGKTEVTQKLWRAVMCDNPSIFKGDRNPVENVSWDDCQEFIRKLNQLTGQRFRLPKEAEWEYAARGGNQSIGYEYSGSNDLKKVAWYYYNSGSKPHPVATLAPNELGIYDMLGNVFEWTADKYSDNYNSPRDWDYRVYRGGCFDYDDFTCHVAARNTNHPSLHLCILGLRLAL